MDYKNKSESFEELAKREFSGRLKRLREHFGLSQQQFGEFFGLSQNTIRSYESGNHSIGIDKMEMFARAFGLRHYQLANPDFVFPPKEKLPADLRRYIAKVERLRQQLTAANDTKRSAGERIYQTGRSKQLYGLYESGYFSRSRTVREVFYKINAYPKTKPLSPDEQKELARITSTLSGGRFLKLLDKLEPAPGTTAVRFVMKDPNVIKYIDTPSGTKDMAADGG